MPAYVIAEIEVTDPDGYKSYSTPAPKTVIESGGRFLVRGGPAELLEGHPEPKRIVVLEFADAAAARRWYNSPDYQKILPHRLKNSKGRLILVEGAS